MRLLDYVTKYTSPNKSGDFRPESITIHWWGEPRNYRSGRIGGVVNWLIQERAGASAHFVVSGVEGRFACIVPLNKTSWHSANWTGNHRSASIEMHPYDDATPKEEIEADLQAAAYVVALLWHWFPKLKNVPLKGHRDWVATECPGDRYYAALTDIRRRARKLYPHVDPARPGVLTNTITLPSPPGDPVPKDWFDMASKQDLREVVAEYAGDVVPNPKINDNTDPTWLLANVAGYTLTKVHRAEQNSAATLEIVRTMAAAPGPLTEDQIEAAARRGLESIIDDATTTTVLEVDTTE